MKGALGYAQHNMGMAQRPRRRRRHARDKCKWPKRSRVPSSRCRRRGSDRCARARPPPAPWAARREALQHTSQKYQKQKQKRGRRCGYPLRRHRAEGSLYGAGAGAGAASSEHRRRWHLRAIRAQDGQPRRREPPQTANATSSARAAGMHRAGMHRDPAHWRPSPTATQSATLLLWKFGKRGLATGALAQSLCPFGVPLGDPFVYLGEVLVPALQGQQRRC